MIVPRGKRVFMFSLPPKSFFPAHHNDIRETAQVFPMLFIGYKRELRYGFEQRVEERLHFSIAIVPDKILAIKRSGKLFLNETFPISLPIMSPRGKLFHQFILGTHC